MPLQILNRVNFQLFSEISGEQLQEKMKSTFNQ